MYYPLYERGVWRKAQYSKLIPLGTLRLADGAFTLKDCFAGLWRLEGDSNSQ